MKNVTDTLKIMTGRKLSQRSMRKAKSSDQDDSNKSRNTLKNSKGGYTKIIRGDFGLHTTPDASYGMARPHTNYYAGNSKTKRYDTEGNLEKVDYSDKHSQFNFEKTHNPAGSWIGAKNKGPLNLIKKLSGKKLTGKQTNAAHNAAWEADGKPTNVVISNNEPAIPQLNTTKHNKTIKKEKDGTYTMEVIEETYSRTPDAISYQPTARIIMKFDENGLITEKSVERVTPKGPVTKNKIVKYIPHGRLIGKTTNNLK